MQRTRTLLLAAGVIGTAFLAGSSVTFYDESLPTTMNPLFARSMVDYRAHELIFDRLYYRSPITNEMMSRVVEEDERQDGGKALKITLKKGIKWHDGQPLTPEDVCFTVNAMLNPRTPSSIAKPYREAIESCVPITKQRVAIITFKKTFHNPQERVGFSILPKHAFESTAVNPDMAFSSRPIGTGLMKATRGTKAVKYTAVPNLHQNPLIQVMAQSEGGDPYVQVKTIINGGVNGIIAVPPSLRPEVAAADDLALKSYDLRSWWFIAVNTKRGPLEKQGVRQALDLALDRNELRELTIGVDPDDEYPPCEFVSGPFVPSSAFYNRQVPLHETSDLDKVNELMLAAGATQQVGKWLWKGDPISLKIGMNAPLDSEAKDLLNQVGNQLQAAGFDCRVYNVSSEEWSRKALTGQLSSEYDMLIGKWSFGLVEDVNPLFHTRGNGKGVLNIFNYSDSKVDQLLAQYDAAKTDTEAKDAYHELHAYLAKDLPYIFLWKLDTKSAWRTEIRNNIITPYYYFTEFEGWKYEE